MEENLKTFAAICIALVAILSFIILVVQSRASRKHYRLSVRPLIQMDYRTGPLNHPKGLFLDNRGIGPAVIKKFRIVNKSKSVRKYENIRYGNDIKKFFLENNQHFDNARQYGFTGISGILKSSESLPISVSTPSETEESVNYFSNFIRKLEFYVEYQSIYGETFHYKSWES